MMYAVLYNPGHNRVYYEASLKLSVSEFNIAARKLSAAVEDVQHINIQGIDYLAFRTGSELTLQDIRIISGLSFAYALFEVRQIGGETFLRPIKKVREDFIDESISTILKYTGKPTKFSRG